MGIFKAIKEFFTGTQTQENTSQDNLGKTNVSSYVCSKVSTVKGILDAEFEPGEKELVAAIASAGLAGSRSDVSIRVVSVKKVDQQMLVAGIIASAVAAGDNPDAQYQIKNIYCI